MLGTRKSAGMRLAFQPSLKGRALKFLSQREHTRRELERKLGRYEEAPGTLASVLDELQAKGYLNEQRAAESLVHRRAGQLGESRIRLELQEKGLTQDIVKQALQGLRETELQRATEVWRRKFAAPPVTAREHVKQARFLIARGFAGEVVRRVLADAGTRHPDELA